LEDAVLNQELLDRARAAQTAVADAERQALLSRGGYHVAVRRLHLAGGSLREIAQALGVSHQRIQQIVEIAGGSWWSRMWRTRTVRRDAVCTFCDRPSDEVSKLIAGPNVYICDACVGASESVLRGGASARATKAAVTSKLRCSFCSKRVSERRPVVSGSVASICSECVRICREILEQPVAPSA
jgi:hypothetical protein